MISVRTVAEAGLVWSGVSRLATRGRRGRTIILAYHNIVPDAEPVAGDRSLHVRQEMFGRQLDLLAQTCDVVPLATVLAEPPDGARPRAAITFDDAYHGALTLGAAELRARGLPATVFAPGGLLGGEAFWWDAIAGPDGLPDAMREHALTTLRGDGDAVRRWASETGRPLHPVSSWLQPAVESELGEWARDGRLTIGSHTWRHLNLAQLTPAEIEVELAKPLVWLRERFSTAMVPWITYPYGLVTPAVVSAARGKGYNGALVVSGGWLRRPMDDPYMLPRLSIPAGLSIRGLKLRLAGLLGTSVA